MVEELSPHSEPALGIDLLRPVDITAQTENRDEKMFKAGNFQLNMKFRQIMVARR